MNEIKVINKSMLLGKEIDVYGSVDDPLFLAKDVAKWIEHTQPSKMVETVDEDEKLMGTIFLSGQNREVWMLTESGLYEVFDKFIKNPQGGRPTIEYALPLDMTKELSVVENMVA